MNSGWINSENILNAKQEQPVPPYYMSVTKGEMRSAAVCDHARDDLRDSLGRKKEGIDLGALVGGSVLRVCMMIIDMQLDVRFER